MRKPSTIWALLALCGLALMAGKGHGSSPTNSPSVSTPNLLLADEVLGSVTNLYPPLLAALIERDIAAGRLRSAQGSFDFQVFSKLFGTPAGYYESVTSDTGFEQFTGIWGSTIFGGYRLTRGDLLPDYDKDRTERSGEGRLGFRIPLLRDGSIDRRRAAISKAMLDQELANPVIQRQQLDFIRAATVAYYNWLGAGLRFRLAEEVLRIARERTQALTNQTASGLLPRIVLTDNERLVVARSIGVVQARRRFEAASLALSLFYRGPDEQPTLASRDRLPSSFPERRMLEPGMPPLELELALLRRPEIRRLKLTIEKTEVDLRLARNQQMPNLDAGVMVTENFGNKPYKDRAQTELEAGIELKMPLQRREAKGRIADFEGQILQLKNQERFARERVRNEIQDARSAIFAALEQIEQAMLNVTLARELQAAENERFAKGATDLLALQIREQTAFEAELAAVEASLEYFRALADFDAATALSAPVPASAPAQKRR